MLLQGFLGAVVLTNIQRLDSVETQHTAKPPAQVLNGIQATMIGHATVLIQVDGGISTDPIYL